jgi:hypothetical protein
MNKFEQLIEYVINDDEQKARALFHDIVVEKSREIYENIMAEEELAEADHEEKIEEGEESLEEDELEEAADHEAMEEGAMMMDASDQMIDEIEVEETDDMSMEAEDDEGSGAAATKDDIKDLADKLDELMADFEAMMGGDMGDDDMGDGDDFEMDAGGDAIEVDDTEEMLPKDDEMMEAVSLKAAPKPVTSEEGSVNKKSTVAANAGAKGPIGSSVKPVHTTGAEAKGRPAPTTKDLIGKVGNSPAQGTQKPTPATKPHTAQATGVNTKSVVPSSHN